MSYIKGWNYALEKAIEAVKLYISNIDERNNLVQILKEEKVYEN